jgi:hypothetical protein
MASGHGDCRLRDRALLVGSESPRLLASSFGIKSTLQVPEQPIGIVRFEAAAARGVPCGVAGVVLLSN